MIPPFYAPLKVRVRPESWADHIDYALSHVMFDGLYCEFGVYEGHTLTYMAQKKPNVTFHGFDSFRGLPEPWLGQPIGHLDKNGEAPTYMPPNVVLHAGFFEDTLPGFVAGLSQKAAFLHIDSDIYSAAKTIFDNFAPMIVAGTVIVFDEYITGDAMGDERQALFEFLQESGYGFVYLSHHMHGGSVAIHVM